MVISSQNSLKKPGTGTSYLIFKKFLVHANAHDVQGNLVASTE